MQVRSIYQNGQLLQMDNVGVAPFNPSQPPLDPNDPATEIMKFTVVKSKNRC